MNGAWSAGLLLFFCESGFGLTKKVRLKSDPQQSDLQDSPCIGLTNGHSFEIGAS